MNFHADAIQFKSNKNNAKEYKSETQSDENNNKATSKHLVNRYFFEQNRWFWIIQSAYFVCIVKIFNKFKCEKYRMLKFNIV